MANDCLITKLKGIVDNNNLPKLGEFQIQVPVGMTNIPASTACYVAISMKTGNTAKVTSKNGTLRKTNGDIVSSITLDTVLSTSPFYSSSANDIIKVTNKYNFNNFLVNCSDVQDKPQFLIDFNQLKYSKLNRFELSGFAFNLELLLFDDLSFLESSIDTLTTFKVSNFGPNSLINIDLMDLASYTHLTDINFSNSLCKSIDFKDFALAMIAAGRETATITVGLSTSSNEEYKMYFDGVEKTTGFYTLSWTSSSNITMVAQ